MARLTCEMCNSTDFIKEDGAFVCQGCGMKYSVEEAKKMIGNDGEATDNNNGGGDIAVIDNLLNNAKKFLDMKDYKKAGSYYNRIVDLCPDDWSATFYSLYCTAMSCTYAEAEKYIELLMQSTVTIPDMITNQYVDSDGNPTQELFDALMEYYVWLYAASISLCASLLAFSNECGSGTISDQYRWAYKKKSRIVAELLTSMTLKWLDYSEIYDNELYLKIILDSYKYFNTWEHNDSNLERLKRSRLPVGSMDQEDMDRILAGATPERTEAIQRFEPEYRCEVLEVIDWLTENKEILRQEHEEKLKELNKGCYVATAVYGSYDCPEVWTLRRFRDYTLAETWYGRAFIKTYYAVSPTLVKWFGHTEWFKKMWRGKLDRMVARLRENGVESTPYEDRNW